MIKYKLKYKAERIKVIAFDVDGVLTDGGIIYDNEGNEFKKFNVKDGFIIKELKKMGFIVGAITGRSSNAVKRRCKELDLNFHYHGAEDKMVHFKDVKELFKVHDYEIAYIGDDLNDLAVLTTCGLAACPADAPQYIQSEVDYVCQKAGGKGVLRELAELVLDSQNLMEKLIQPYLKK